MEKVKTAADIMTTDVVVLPKAASLNEFVRIMEKKGITKIPVVDDGKFVGVISDRHVLDKIGSIRSQGINPAKIHVVNFASKEEGKDFRIVSPDTPIRTIVGMAKEFNVPMFIVMENSELVGVITKSDLLKLVTSEKPVDEIAVNSVISVTPHDRLIHARHLMLEHGIERLPVLHEGIVTGIISEMDIALSLVKIKEKTPTRWVEQHLRNAFIKEHMVTEVIMVEPETKVKEAAEIMVEEEIGCLPIVRYYPEEEVGNSLRTMDPDVLRVLQMRLEEGRIPGYPKIFGIVARTDLIRTIEI